MTCRGNHHERFETRMNPRLRFIVDPGAEGGGATPPPETPPNEDAVLGAEGISALRAERARAKAAEAARDKLTEQIAEAERAKLSDLERMTADLAASTQRAAVAEARALRYEIAGNKGIPLALAPRLIGSTREEIESDAATLLATLAATPGAKQAPAPDPSAGAAGAPGKRNIAELMEEMRGKKTT